MCIWVKYVGNYHASWGGPDSPGDVTTLAAAEKSSTVF